jgi:hypothetical protein
MLCFRIQIKHEGCLKKVSPDVYLLNKGEPKNAYQTRLQGS